MNLPQVHAITLESTPERTERLSKHLTDQEIQWTQFKGIDAAKWGISTTHAYDLDGTPRIVEQKHVGLHLSHWILWRELLLRDGDAFTILEDDACFLPGWQADFDVAFDNLPSCWDMVLIGSGNTFDKPKMRWSENVWSVRYPQTTHAYVVRRRALETLIATQQKAWAPIDISLAIHSYPKLGVFTVLPRLVIQHGQEYIRE